MAENLFGSGHCPNKPHGHGSNCFAPTCICALWQARLAAAEKRAEELAEFKNAIISLCKAIGLDEMTTWGGDKTGWGFIHYFVKHLHIRAEAAEASSARMREALVKIDNLDGYSNRITDAQAIARAALAAKEPK